MAGRCSICTSFQREQIEKAIKRGAPYREIARRFGLSKTAISRHVKNHLPWGKVLSGLRAQTMAEYHSLELNCPKAGVYEVSKEKTSQVLRTFPLDFERIV